uniref:30S ribosomal protein S8 n=1 Tax=Marophrys sp. SRT127 TaxID=2488311 RepID=A0A455RE97_9EUKA|nr:30S ribosomal protein S8 [Marophrys sp. SRT127]
MSNSSPLSNLLSHIKNAQKNRILVIEHPRTKLIIGFLTVLREHGYIRGYRFHSHSLRLLHKQRQNKIEILLKYRNQAPAINNIMRISKPSKKLYITVKALADLESSAKKGMSGVISPRTSSDDGSCSPQMRGNPPLIRRRLEMSPFMRGIYILSTPKGGIISSTLAYKLNTGGEVLGHVW